MRRLPLLILAMAVLVAMVTGCGGTHRYDSRLTAADSLMRTDPDSALATLNALPDSAFTSEGDLAYRGLLLAQARYKAYVTATSDSDINRALDYYRRHDGEREKLTRAYIYKGAVMEELGHPDSAMLYYKHAEATADEKDYTNLGQINTRIADLYRRYYADSEICFDKYKQALQYHTLTKDKSKQQNCLYNMAVCQSLNNGDPRPYLKQALDLAIELNDSLSICMCLERLCRHLSMRESKIHEAKQIGLKCLDRYTNYCTAEVMLDLAYIYAKEKQSDSARFYLGMIDHDLINQDEQKQVWNNYVLSLIAMNEGDTVGSNFYNRLKNQITDSIDDNAYKIDIQRIENAENHKLSSTKNKRIHALKWTVTALVIIFIIALGALIIYHMFKIRQIRLIVKEIKQQSEINKHQDLLKQIDEKNSVISDFVHSLVAFMQITIDASEKDSPRIIKRRVKEIVNQVANNNFWNELRIHLDHKYDGLISDIATNSKITESDLRFIELSCCGFDYIEIAITLGLSPNYISNKRRTIARKLHLRIPLQEYLNQKTKLQKHSKFH